MISEKQLLKHAATHGPTDKQSHRKYTVMNGNARASRAKARALRTLQVRSAECTERMAVTLDCAAFNRGKKKLEVFLQTNEGKKVLEKEAKLHQGDKSAAKRSMVKLIKLKVLKRQIAQAKAIERQRCVAVPAAAAVKGASTRTHRRRTSEEAIQKWLGMVRKERECQNSQFCAILKAAVAYMRAARQNNRVPDYDEIVSEITEQGDSDDLEHKYEKYIRKLIDVFRMN